MSAKIKKAKPIRQKAKPVRQKGKPIRQKAKLPPKSQRKKDYRQHSSLLTIEVFLLS